MEENIAYPTTSEAVTSPTQRQTTPWLLAAGLLAIALICGSYALGYKKVIPLTFLESAQTPAPSLNSKNSVSENSELSSPKPMQTSEAHKTYELIHSKGSHTFMYPENWFAVSQEQTPDVIRTLVSDKPVEFEATDVRLSNISLSTDLGVENSEVMMQESIKGVKRDMTVVKEEKLPSDFGTITHLRVNYPTMGGGEEPADIFYIALPQQGGGPTHPFVTIWVYEPTDELLKVAKDIAQSFQPMQINNTLN